MLSWKVWIEDFNARCIKPYDVLGRHGVTEEIKDAVRDAENKEAFAAKLRHILMYHYWSRCEWEITLTSWPPKRGDASFKDETVDVFSQIMLNWHVFVDYIWNNRQEFLKEH